VALCADGGRGYVGMPCFNSLLQRRRAADNKRSHCRTGLHPPERRPLVEKLLLTNKGVTALLGGLGSVLISEDLQLNLQGVEDRMVFVHRSVATVTILTESEDFEPLPGLVPSPVANVPPAQPDLG
jgi:hypothetical protein